MVSQWALLLFLLALLVVFLLLLIVYRRRRTPNLRPIPAFEELPDQTGRATESGQTLHLSLGTGGVGGLDSVTSLAGLSALSYLAEQGAATGTPPMVTVAHPTMVPLAQNVLRGAYARQGRLEDFRWTQVRLISPAPFAYALGTLDIVTHEPVLANVMLGAFGPEVALIARGAEDAGLVQLAGTDDPRALAVLLSSTDRVVVGEELYATSAYLSRARIRVTSLVTADAARLGLIVFIIGLALYRLAGL